MAFTVLKVAGADALRLLDEHRSRYASTGLYPFLIGDAKELSWVEEAAEHNPQESPAIIDGSLELNTAEWIAECREEKEQYEPSLEDLLGEWPGDIAEKGSITLHKNSLSGKIKPEVYLGLAKIEMPWHLPAVLKYGAWNDCPEPEVHCAFHRQWQEKYGAEITGISHDVVECVVKKPPIDRQDAISLAWEQYWYCPDIVEQGCESVANLAATLLNSKYWFFWWD